MKEETYCIDKRFLRAGKRHGIALLKPKEVNLDENFFKKIKVENLRASFYNEFGFCSKIDSQKSFFSGLDRYTFSHSVDLSGLPFDANYFWSRKNKGFFPLILAAERLNKPPHKFSNRKQLYSVEDQGKVSRLDFDVSLDYYFEFKKNENDRWKYIDYYKKDLLEILSSGYSKIKFKPFFEDAN